MCSKAETWDGPAILHVDMDAFFAAVEQLDHPELRGKPVIVGGLPGKRGVVATCSYEARVFGVRSAMPSARAAHLCPDAIWVRGNFERYREMSAAVRSILAEESPRVQPMSIDEAYLDVTPGRFSSEHPVDVAVRIRDRIDTLGISASVGVATSKTVAKIASDRDKPHGLTVVRPGEEAAFLAPLPVRALPGVGPKTAARLESLGIRTLGDLAGMDETSAVAALGVHGPSTVLRAQGIDGREVRDNDAVKSVSNERTFAQDVRAPGQVDGALDALSAKVGARLRGKGVAGRTVTVKLRFSDFTTRTVRRTLPAPTNDESVFGPIARELVRTAWSPGVGLRLLGVGMSGFADKTVQESLFACEDSGRSTSGQDSGTPRREAILRGVDAVRERFGSDAVLRGRDFAPRADGARDSKPEEMGDDV